MYQQGCKFVTKGMQTYGTDLVGSLGLQTTEIHSFNFTHWPTLVQSTWCYNCCCLVKVAVGTEQVKWQALSATENPKAKLEAPSAAQYPGASVIADVKWLWLQHVWRVWLCVATLHMFEACGLPQQLVPVMKHKMKHKMCQYVLSESQMGKLLACFLLFCAGTSAGPFLTHCFKAWFATAKLVGSGWHLALALPLALALAAVLVAAAGLLKTGAPLVPFFLAKGLQKRFW